MSNRININVAHQDDGPDVILLFDEHASTFIELEGLASDLDPILVLELIGRCDNPVVADFLDHIKEHNKGCTIRGTVYEWSDLKSLFDE